MKAVKLSFDFGDYPEIAQMLREHAVATGESQKQIVIRALESYFAQKLESKVLWKAAEKTFSEWDNEDDEVYNSF